MGALPVESERDKDCRKEQLELKGSIAPGRTTMNTNITLGKKSCIIAAALALFLAALAARPEQAAARSEIVISTYSGGIGFVAGNRPTYGYSRAPVYAYRAEPRYWAPPPPPPPRYWHYTPPPRYWDRDRHHHRYRHWHRDRW